MFNLSRRFTTSDRSNRASHGRQNDAHDDARYGAWAEDSVTEDSDVPGRHMASAKNPNVTPRSLSSTISFSDFSMHVHDDTYDDGHGIDHHPQLPRVATKPVAIPLQPSLNSSMNSTATRNSIDNAELGMQGSGMVATKSLRIQTKSSGGMSGSTAQQLSSPVSKSLGIPSVASIFGTPKVGIGMSGNGGNAAGNASATPRSSLDLYDGTMSSAPTPTRTSADEGASVPVTPRSPGGSKSPGGSRRRGDRIQGLDSFEWLELVRGSSL